MSWLTRTIYAPASISYWPGLSTLGYGLSLFVLTSIVNTPSRTSLSPPLPFSLGYDLSFPSPSWGMECERVYRSVRGLRAISIYYIRSIITITHPIIAGFDIWPGLYWPNPNFSYRQFETSAKACSLSTILHALANRSTEYRRVYARWQGGDGRQNVNACWRSIVQLSVISQSYLLRGRKEQVNGPFQFWLSLAKFGWIRLSCLWVWCEIDFPRTAGREGCDIDPSVAAFRVHTYFSVEVAHFCPGPCERISLIGFDLHEIEFRAGWPLRLGTCR